MGVHLTFLLMCYQRAPDQLLCLMRQRVVTAAGFAVAGDPAMSPAGCSMPHTAGPEPAGGSVFMICDVKLWNICVHTSDQAITNRIMIHATGMSEIIHCTVVVHADKVSVTILIRLGGRCT